MKRWMAILMTAVLLFTLCGCLEQPEETPKGTGLLLTGTDVWNLELGADSDRLDPAFASHTAEESYLLHLFEGLTTVDADGSVLPALAESWKVEYDRTRPVYTFTLREGLQWSDGEPLTADDLVYAWQRLVSRETASPNAYLLYPVLNARSIHLGVADEETGEISYTAVEELGIEAVDEHTFSVTLEGECPYFLQLTALPQLVPVRQAAVEGKGAFSVSNGPYLVENWTSDQSLTLLANPCYREPNKAPVERLHFVFGGDAALDEALYEDFASGGLLYMSDHSPLHDEEASAAGLLESEPLGLSYYYIFNTAREGVSSELVRRAISLSVDRGALLETVPGLEMAAAKGIVPGAITDGEGHSFRNETTDSWLSGDASVNLDLARELLAQAGYPQGVGLPDLTLMVSDSALNVAIAQSAAEQIREALGVTLTVQAVKAEQLSAELASGEWDLVRSGFLSHCDNPYLFLESFGSEREDNLSALVSEDLDDLLEQGRSEEKAAERLEALRKAEQLLVSEQAAVLPLFEGRQSAVCSAALTGVRRTAAGHTLFLGAVYLPESDMQ